MLTATSLAEKIYDSLIGSLNNGKIPIALRARQIVGTVQDDPFDCWIEEEIRNKLPELQVYHSGTLTTPDLVIRDPFSNSIIGVEVKKLIQKPNGADPRGMTIDYNSCLPCGKTLIKVGNDTVEIPCYYIFALLNVESSDIVTTILMDGDFLNYDFDLHKEAKYANQSEYAHGPYAEGSVRHRRMYTYPNPLNYKLSFFFQRHILIVKKNALPELETRSEFTDVIVRDDRYKNSFQYVVVDKTSDHSLNIDQLPVRKDIFLACKNRSPKERTASMPQIPSAD